MKILFAGTPANAAKTLELLAQEQFEIVGVLTRPDATVGRKKVLTPSPVAVIAESLGLPVIKSTKVTTDVLRQVSSLKPDLGVVVAYGALLSTEALTALEKGWVNLHYSLLPDWRGAAPVQHTLLAGDAETGVTLFQIDEGLDTGPVFGAVKTLVNPDETAGELLNRLTLIGASLLAEQLPRIASGIANPTPQDQGKSRVAAKLNRSLALIDWNLKALEIEHLVRALNPEPVAYTYLHGESLRILRARKVSWELALASDANSVAQTSQNGTVFGDKKRIFVRCGETTALELLELQPSGKRLMSASDWFRGITGTSVQFENQVTHG